MQEPATRIASDVDKKSSNEMKAGTRSKKDDDGKVTKNENLGKIIVTSIVRVTGHLRSIREQC